MQRAVRPAAAAALLFAKSNILGGYFTYIVLLAAVCGSLCVAVQLASKDHVEVGEKVDRVT
jgi:hypothetical protein